MSTNKQSGFTLVEVAVIAPIIILVLGGVIALLIGLLTDTIASRTELEIIHQTGDTLHTIEDDVKITSAFLTTTGSGFTDPYGTNGSGGAWSYKGTSATDRVLILQSYATTRSPRDSLKGPVYVNENGCTADQLLSNPALQTNIIYFVRNGNLYRRILTDTSKSICQTPFQRQSCTPNLASPNPICKTEDSLLLSNVVLFDVHYYDTPTATAKTVYTSNDPTILDSPIAIRVKLATSKDLGTRNFYFHRELQVNRLNDTSE